MGLLSYFKRQPGAETSAPAALAAAPEPDAVAAARARARRRLLGATVLLGLGVIGFPLLFETQPRPIAVDIPIEIPRKDGAAALTPAPVAAPMARASAAVVGDGRPSTSAGLGAAGRAAAAPSEIVERANDPGRELASPVSRPSTPQPAVLAEAKAPAAAPASKAAVLPAPASKPVAPAQAAAPASARPGADDGARARALLEGQGAAPAVSVPAVTAPAITAPAASAAGARVVVQVGAYTDAAKLAEARRKLEAMGFKTYTQVVETEAGKRTRVRVGPFANRAEADKAAARLKSAGLPAAILTL